MSGSGPGNDMSPAGRWVADHKTRAELDRDEDEYVPMLAIHCPDCGTFVAELPEDELVGQMTCPNCEEDFDVDQE